MDERLSLFKRVMMLKKLHGGQETLIGTDTEPYQYRSSPSLGDYKTERDEIVGVSVGFNQLCGTSWRNAQTYNNVAYTPNNDGTFTLDGTANADDYWSVAPYTSGMVFKGHKYYMCEANHNGSPTTFGLGFVNGNIVAYGNVGTIVSASSDNQAITYSYKSGAVMDNVKLKPMLIDLTQMLGTTIADYIYTLEQGTAGSGVAFFRKYFGADYYPYDSGSIRSVEGLVSHDMVGFNQWDEEWEVGGIDPATGANVGSSEIRSKNYIEVLSNTAYYCHVGSSAGQTYNIKSRFYDADKNYIGTGGTWKYNGAFTIPSGAQYLRFAMQPEYGTTYNHDICINISDAELNGQYKPYTKHSYPLDSTVTLRGLLKLEDGKLKADGDVYKADGSVTRKYGVVDLGTLNWSYDSGQRFSATINDMKQPSSGQYASGLVCARFVADASPIQQTHIDRTIAKYLSSVYIYDSAYTDATTFKTAMNGVMLVYELATPTTDTAQPFAKNQKVSPSGTEEYVTTSVVPVGHNTEYYG